MLANSADLKSSAMYIGYHILKEIQRQKNDKISIYDISRALKKEGVGNSRQIILGLSFLFSVDILDFEEAMVWIKK